MSRQKLVAAGERSDPPPAQPLRGRGGPQLKPDAFAATPSPTKNRPSEKKRTAKDSGKAAAKLAPPPSPPRPPRNFRRALATHLAPTLANVQQRTAETLGRARRFQRRARVRVSDGVASARMRASSLLAKPRDRIHELEVAARGRTISNRIEALSELDRDETELIRDFAMSQTRTHQSGSHIVHEAEAAPTPVFIASGWACRLRMHAGGRRQIIGILLPGDAIGLRGAAEPDATTSIGALTQVESVDARELLIKVERSNRYSNLERAIQRAEAQEKEFLTNQIARLGGMGTADRFADLMRELKWRLQQSGLADDDVFPMPLDQRGLMSALNMNSRDLKSAMRRLKRKQAFRLRNRRARLRDFEDETLYPAGGFRPPSASLRADARPSPRIISS